MPRSIEFQSQVGTNMQMIIQIIKDAIHPTQGNPPAPVDYGIILSWEQDKGRHKLKVYLEPTEAQSVEFMLDPAWENDAAGHKLAQDFAGSITLMLARDVNVGSSINHVELEGNEIEMFSL